VKLYKQRLVSRKERLSMLNFLHSIFTNLKKVCGRIFSRFIYREMGRRDMQDEMLLGEQNFDGKENRYGLYSRQHLGTCLVGL